MNQLSDAVNKIYKVIPASNCRYLSESRAKKILESEYQMRAVEFLIETGTTCRIEFTGLSRLSWSNKRHNSYEVTLSRLRDGKRLVYTFPFYDSIRNTEEGKKATYDFYSILACLNLSHCNSFDDFCSDYGYEFKTEREYTKAKQTYLDVMEQDRELRRMFNAEELQKLSKIN